MSINIDFENIPDGVICNLILSIDDNDFSAKVQDAIFKSKRVFISTYNISKSEKSNYIKTILETSAHVELVTNVPNRYDTYYNSTLEKKGQQAVDLYVSNLDSDNIDLFFNFKNHAKIICTDNLLYIGSANFSDESTSNYESGILMTSDNLSGLFFNMINEFIEELKSTSLVRKKLTKNFVKDIIFINKILNIISDDKEFVFATDGWNNIDDMNEWVDEAYSNYIFNTLARDIDTVFEPEIVEVYKDHYIKKYPVTSSRAIAWMARNLDKFMSVCEFFYYKVNKKWLVESSFEDINSSFEYINELYESNDLEKTAANIFEEDYLFESGNDNLDDCLDMASQRAIYDIDSMDGYAKDYCNKINSEAKKMHRIVLRLKEEGFLLTNDELVDLMINRMSLLYGRTKF